jgi:hypothetical protein
VNKSVEELLIYWLPTQLPGVSAADAIPSDLADLVDLLPFIKVIRTTGGRAPGSIISKPFVDLDVFVAASSAEPGMARVAALNFAQQVENLFVWALPTMILGHVVSLDGVVSGPARRNYENPDVARAGLSVGLSAHYALA